MWQTLAEFSDNRIENLYSREDFKPMKRLILNLRKKDFAKEVYSYTSLFTSCITLQSEYSYEKNTDSIYISYSSELKGFSVTYNDIHLDEHISYFCKEKNVLNLLYAFVLRLFLTKENKFIPIETEQTPSFQIG